MLTFGWFEFILIVAVILLIFGPGRIVKSARWLGSALASLRDRLFGGHDRKG